MRFINNHITILVGLCGLLTLQACQKGLNYPNTNVINPDNVWKDSTMIGAFLSDIYGGLNPGWPYTGSASDEGISQPQNLGAYQRGIISVEKSSYGLSYTYIDKINFFLDQLPAVSTSVLSSGLKNQFTGEALFWRAWDYWNKVATFGGVPLILHTQDISNKPGLFVPRNKTSECMARIIKDLDSAILLLPPAYNGSGYGRITKGAAMAFKGRVLLWYASPLFNPSNDPARWQTAYTANKTAVDFLTQQGNGLYPDYRQIWYQKRNKELVMVNQFYYPDHPNNQNLIRPEPLTKDASNTNQPLLSLLNAYPKRDGSPLQFDKNLLADPAYNAQYLTDFYTNRDDRFYATVFCGGTVYPTPDLPAPNRFWNAWKWDAVNNKYVNILNEVNFPGGAQNSGCTGFFDRKGLDTTLTLQLVGNGQVDWPEIRFAEVLMNYGECANETGSTSEALNVLYQIRARAGILPGGSNTYGVTAASQNDIRAAYINERFVEFAFENKRFGDLRRWKRYDILNSQGARHGMYLVINSGQTVTATDDIMTPSVRAKFKAVYIDNLDGDPSFYFNLDLNHWFYPIAQSNLDVAPQLIQNNEWGGAFDPLQ